MAGPEKFDEILDSVSYRFRAAAQRAFNGGLSIQNVAGTLCQVDDLGNVTPLIGGTIGGITAITGDVVATGPGVVNSVIQPGRVTYAKIQNVSDAVLLGNNSGGAASVQELTKAQVISFLGLAAIATSGSAGDLTSGTLPAGRFPALTGDVTTVAGSLVTTVNILATRIPFGDVSNHMATSGNLTWDNAAQILSITASSGTGMQSAITLNALHAPGILFKSNGVARGQFGIGDGGTATAATLNFSTVGGIVDQVFTVTNDVNTDLPFILSVMGADAGIGSKNHLSVGAVTGFAYLPTIVGAPTTAPAPLLGGATFGNRTASVIDDGNRRIYCYVGGGWHYAPLDDGASSGITQLVGDAQAGPGTGVQTLTILPNVVTLAKMQQIATNSLLGRSTAGTGNVEVITVGSGLTLTGGTLTSTSSGGTITALTGDVTASGSGSVAATIAAGAVTTSKIAALNITTALLAAASVTTAKVANNAITYALIQAQADQTILGNVSGGTASPSALTKSQVLALLNSGLATGILGVTATSGALNSSALVNTCVPFATGVNTLGTSNNFSFTSGIDTLTVPVVAASGSGSLTLKSAAVSMVFNNGPATVTLSGGMNINGTTGVGSVGEALFFGKTGDQAITKSGGTFSIGTTDTNAIVFLQNGGNIAQYTSASGWRHSSTVYPAVDVTYDLGASATAWNNLYVQNITRAASNVNVSFATDSFDANAASTGGITLSYGGVHRLKVNSTGIGFLGTTPVAQQTGGAFSAGATYTGTEQGMLNKAYACLQAFGLLS